MRTQQLNASKEWQRGWKLVLACSTGFSYFSVLTISVGMFMGPLEDEFGWSRTLMSAGITIAAITTALLSPFFGMVIDKFGSRRVALPGLVLTMIAFSAFSLVNGSPLQWLLLWAVYAVISITVKTTVWVSAVAGAFQSAQGLALGITLCGTAITQTLVPPLADWLITEFGWRIAYLALGLGWGAAALATCFFFLHEGPSRVRPKTIPSEDRHTTTHLPATTHLPGLTVAEAFRNSALWRIAITTLVIMALTMGLMIHQIPILLESGIPRSQAAWLVSLGGIAGIVGKLLTGALLDRFRPNWLGGVTLATTALAFALLLDGVRSPTLVVVAMVINGYSAGTKLQICSYLTARYAGQRQFGTIYGFMVSLVALGTGIGPILAGLAYDNSGSYSPFLIAGSIGCLLCGALIMSLPPYPAATNEKLHPAPFPAIR